MQGAQRSSGFDVYPCFRIQLGFCKNWISQGSSTVPGTVQKAVNDYILKCSLNNEGLEHGYLTESETTLTQYKLSPRTKNQEPERKCRYRFAPFEIRARNWN